MTQKQQEDVMHSTAAVARAQARSPRRTSATEKEGPFIQTRQLAQERKSRGLWASNESIGRLVQQKTLRHSSPTLRNGISLPAQQIRVQSRRPKAKQNSVSPRVGVDRKDPKLGQLWLMHPHANRQNSFRNIRSGHGTV